MQAKIGNRWYVVLGMIRDLQGNAWYVIHDMSKAPEYKPRIVSNLFIEEIHK